MNWMIKTIIKIKIVETNMTSFWFRVKPVKYAKLPKPPAPITPATAVEPTKAIAVTVIPDINAGIASGNNTFLTTVHVVAPIDQAASITPLSISLKAISTNLA